MHSVVHALPAEGPLPGLLSPPGTWAGSGRNDYAGRPVSRHHDRHAKPVYWRYKRLLCSRKQPVNGPTPGRIGGYSPITGGRSHAASAAVSALALLLLLPSNRSSPLLLSLQLRRPMPFPIPQQPPPLCHSLAQALALRPRLPMTSCCLVTNRYMNRSSSFYSVC
jgi:hypothetical protein